MALVSLLVILSRTSFIHSIVVLFLLNNKQTARIHKAYARKQVFSKKKKKNNVTLNESKIEEGASYTLDQSALIVDSEREKKEKQC